MLYKLVFFYLRPSGRPRQRSEESRPLQGPHRGPQLWLPVPLSPKKSAVGAKHVLMCFALAVAWILLTADAASLQRIFLDSPDR